MELSPRQRSILRHVVEEFVATGQPVGSRTLVDRAGLNIAPSTVRHELAELESKGFLTHPHTSAGRVPTESGYRYYAAELLGRLEPQPQEFPLDLHTTRTEVEAALQATTEMLSQVTRLLALVSAPPLEATTIVRVGRRWKTSSLKSQYMFPISTSERRQPSSAACVSAAGCCSRRSSWSS